MTANKTLYVFVVALALRCGPAFAEDGAFSLTVNVSGAKPDRGQAICALFSSSENYLKQPLDSQIKPINAQGEAVCHFARLATGTYAVSVIYDEDRNGELNTGLLGIPTERVGMSNNAKSMFGPPSFEETSFLLSQSGTIDILLGEAKE